MVSKVVADKDMRKMSNIVENLAIETEQCFVNKRWLGGTLTNWKTISLLQIGKH